MPRFCRVKGQDFSDNYIIATLYENACEVVISYFGINPGTVHDSPSDFINTLYGLNSCGLHVIVFIATLAVAFTLGVYLRRQTIVGLLRQRGEWMEKEKLLLNQLWAALEEKLESKSMLQESKTTLDKLKVELNGERADKQSMQSKMWGLEQNVNTIQSERDSMQEKLKDCVSTFSGLRISLGKQYGQGESADVAKCMDKVKSLQSLMQKLIETHRQEHKNFVSILEKQSGC